MNRGAGTGTETGHGARKHATNHGGHPRKRGARFLPSGLYRLRDACCDRKRSWVLILRWGCFEAMRSIWITSRNSPSMTRAPVVDVRRKAASRWVRLA